MSLCVVSSFDVSARWQPTKPDSNYYYTNDVFVASIRGVVEPFRKECCCCVYQIMMIGIDFSSQDGGQRIHDISHHIRFLFMFSRIQTKIRLVFQLHSFMMFEIWSKKERNAGQVKSFSVKMQCHTLL